MTITFLIIYNHLFYTPLFLDYGKRNIIEKTIDFLIFGFHSTKASIYSDYFKNGDKANREFAKAGWYRKRYLKRKFGADGKDLFSVLEKYKRLNLTSLLEYLYIFLIKEKIYDTALLHEAGQIFMINKNWIMSTEAFSIITKSNSEDVMAYYYLGLSYLKIKKLTEAQLNFERVIELEPDFADVYFQLGFIEETKRNWRKAQRLYDRTLTILPNHLECLIALKRINKKTE